jgi:hypothetical protein
VESRERESVEQVQWEEEEKGAAPVLKEKEKKC